MSSSIDPEGAPDALIGTVLADRYRIDKLLGEGGMGKVYAAEHVLMKKRLAIKALHAELCALPEVVARFEREAMATANIDHPNIAAATDFGRLPDGSLFLVLELVIGTSLRDVIASGAIPVERALHIARQIAAALAAAHALEIVHRDLKPENVMLITKGNDKDFVKVLDFGIAKVPIGREHEPSAGLFAAGPLTKAGEVFGTPEYMAPEQALGQNVDGRADLYALGVILFEMLGGVRPFSSKSDVGILAQQLAKPIPSVTELAPGVRIPPRVEQVVAKLLAKEVAQRFQTADEALQALDELVKPAPAAGGRLFTLTDGSPTAFLGTIAELSAAGVPAPADAAQQSAEPSPPDLEVPPPAPPPGGTLPLLDADKQQELMERVAEARADQPAKPKRPSRLKPALKRLSTRTREMLVLVCQYIDANRGRLPPRIRHALRKVPAGAILAFTLVVVWGGLLLGTVWIAGARSKAPAPAASASDSASRTEQPKEDPVLRELADAKEKGHAALEALAERHPTSAPVWVELAASHAAKSDYDSAVASIKKALDADSKANELKAAAEVLEAAVRKRDTAEDSFALLEGSMGAAGARILYDLAIDQKVLASSRLRAERWVRSDAFTKVASPEVEVAAGLRWAKSCSARHELMKRAGEVGGKRVLAFLKITRTRGGCGRRGRDDCFPCLRKDSALKDAIAAVEKRLGEKPETP